MRLHKLKASESTGTYLVESPVTETDILLMARQLANLRLRRGRALTSPKEVFSHLQALLASYEHEVFALLMLDSRHRVLAFQELFRGTLDGASVYPREVVKIALEYNAAAMILVHNHPSGDPEPSQADRKLTTKLQEALNLVGVRTLDHIVVGQEGCVSLAELGYL
ncbi:TPA: DNA repair protein RadC [Pseudomonas aeruginosa]|uniref:DNA repair protein RadC n=3 Tax=Pseudomonas aeruginosa TaxID=287 RepID=A0A241XP49_PSEAI|nr:DNA repair protein RadC [Pseudomonas aeruginosa]AMA35068.1 DNA repair protein RadC [Pseudomonas aeruginosa DHS01]AWE81816.1 DNA repair RadC family protein [Pseudomonas aeruginosa]EJB8385129.1 DNA repair protein RadC [Pseudomonas aeruginosa]EJZ8926341.1 DNA repair protein RadC [Pseudomonas aeruginosa]EKU2895885.1 DNA repair protein RadC [Pseudomonas aeruginosa]